MIKGEADRLETGKRELKRYRYDDREDFLKTLDWVKSEEKIEGYFIIKYLNWSFRTTFTRYILSCIVTYFFWIMMFSLIIFLYAYYAEEECFVVPEGSSPFARAFGLSWTTFSTVGYGSTSPIMSDQCVFITLISALESLIGVLYGGFCGAILFGKVTKVYGAAMVTFSAHYVIQYGTGVDEDDAEYVFETVTKNKRERESEKKDETKLETIKDDDTSLSTSTRLRNSPFPVLVFRIVNDLCNEEYGNILNISLHATAVIINDKSADLNDTLPKRRFADLTLTPTTVPYFRRVLYVHHTLDEFSPLLSREVRKTIEDNSGIWPSELNNELSLIDCLDFEELLITFDGTSEISKSTVMKHKEYHRNDGKIGWEFVNMTRKSDERHIEVMFDLLNDLVEQNGGSVLSRKGLFISESDTDTSSTCITIPPYRPSAGNYKKKYCQ